MTTKFSANDVARWMMEEVTRDQVLEQEVAAYAIAEKFGDEFVYYNANGNLAIKRSVLDAFRRLSEDKVVWSQSKRYWRLREECDEPGRQQDGS